MVMDTSNGFQWMLGPSFQRERSRIHTPVAIDHPPSPQLKLAPAARRADKALSCHNPSPYSTCAGTGRRPEISAQTMGRALSRLSPRDGRDSARIMGRLDPRDVATRGDSGTASLTYTGIRTFKLRASSVRILMATRRHSRRLTSLAPPPQPDEEISSPLRSQKKHSSRPSSSPRPAKARLGKVYPGALAASTACVVPTHARTADATATTATTTTSTDICLRHDHRSPMKTIARISLLSAKRSDASSSSD